VSAIGGAKYGRMLKALKIEQVPVPPEHVGVFERRTHGFWQAAWSRHNHSFEETRKALKVYGISCYMQGLMDGATTAAMKPELVAWLASQRTASESTEAPPSG
jgi:hypothetical protein